MAAYISALLVLVKNKPTVFAVGFVLKSCFVLYYKTKL